MNLFDAHFHVIDPRFPLVANEGFLPSPFTVDDYIAATAPLGVTGGVVVAGSFQAYGQAWLIDALARLGPRYVGVAQLADDVTDDEIVGLDRLGVRAVRANLRQGMTTIDEVEHLARRVDEIAGWHLEVYADAGELDVERLARLPSVVVDHLGLTAAGLPNMIYLAERGHHVKATGFGRLDLDVAPALRSIAAANPAALMFGTDLPSTRSPRPFGVADLELVGEALGPDQARRVVRDNAVSLYRPREVTRTDAREQP